MAMTGLPIMWFTMFDYAHKKDDDLIDYVPLPYPEHDTEEENKTRIQLKNKYEDII